MPALGKPPAIGPISIALGLVILLFAAWLPATPVVTAMALVAYGATDVTLARFRGSPAMVPILLLHTCTYAGLYALFLGALLHSATRLSQGLSLLQALDLCASAGVMTIAGRILVRAVAGEVDSPAR